MIRWPGLDQMHWLPAFIFYTKYCTEATRERNRIIDSRVKGNKTVYYTVMRSLTEIHTCRIMHVQGILACWTNSGQVFTLWLCNSLQSLFSAICLVKKKKTDTFTVDYNFYL